MTEVTQVTEEDRARRHLQDHGRMLWRDDVEGHCETPDVCFEHGETVRCSPCANKQSEAEGVEPINRDRPYLPEVCRLNRALAERDARIAELEAAVACPNAVHANMLRGTIARPTAEQIIHIYGAKALLAALQEIDNAG